MRAGRWCTLLVALALACQRGPSAGGVEPEDRTRVHIENRTSLDLDIFVLRSGGARARLGFAPANETTTFALPPVLTAGSTTLHLEAVPVRESGTPIVSEPFAVRPGDEITWSIPPQ